MNEKLAIITGANGDMGSSLTRDVANAGYKVIMACQDLQKASPRYEQIKKETGKDIELLNLDLASFESIRNFVNQVKEKYQHIDLLLNNAGTLCHFACETKEHIERTVGVNYLGHLILTHLLLPLMGQGTRVVNMISLTIRYGHLKPNFFQPVDKKHFNRFTTYSDSKKALYYFTIDAAETWKKYGISVNCADPGIVSTNIIRQGNKVVDKLCDMFFRPIIRTPSQGAATMLKLALDPELEGETGGRYVNRKLRPVSQELQQSPERTMLRQITANLLKEHGFDFKLYEK